jgi:muramoyltetrapeptide carboxypeptidase
MKILKPRKLKKGDLIGIVSPASPIADSTKIERGVRYLENLGYRVTVGEHVGKTLGYLAGNDDQRVADLHAMFSNKHVTAIIAVRGGYGTPRLLRLLDYRLILRNPKILVGFSDLTALQLALWKKCRLVTFHGPMLGVDMADAMNSFTEESFWQIVTSTTTGGKVALPDETGPDTITQGIAAGRLLGGNLSLLVSVIGTPYAPDFAGSIIFLEEIGEEPYRVDRMLTQLQNAGVFSRANGLLGGQFTECFSKDPAQHSLTIQDVLAETGLSLAKPFLSNLPFGHIPTKMTLPVGVRIRLDAGARSVEYLEPAVC